MKPINHSSIRMFRELFRNSKEHRIQEYKNILRGSIIDEDYNFVNYRYKNIKWSDVNQFLEDLEEEYEIFCEENEEYKALPLKEKEEILEFGPGLWNEFYGTVVFQSVI